MDHGCITTARSGVDRTTNADAVGTWVEWAGQLDCSIAGKRVFDGPKTCDRSPNRNQKRQSQVSRERHHRVLEEWRYDRERRGDGKPRVDQSNAVIWQMPLRHQPRRS